MPPRRIYTSNPVTISRDAARAAGSDVYFTGESCRNGHVVHRRVVNARCVECGRLAQTRKFSDPEKRNAKERARRRLKPENNLFASARRRAAKAGREFTISLSDIKIPERCPCCEQRLEVAMTPRRRAALSCPSVDRIDSKRGYTPDNVAVICLRCNVLKSDGTAEEFENLVAYMRTAEALSRAKMFSRVGIVSIEEALKLAPSHLVKES